MIASTLFEGYRWTPLAACGVVLAIAGNWITLIPTGRRVSNVSVARSAPSPHAAPRSDVPL
jgi:hypothetical protein